MKEKNYRFEVKSFNGAPTLFLSGRPVHGWIMGRVTGMKLKDSMIKCFPDHLYILSIPVTEFETASVEKNITNLLRQDKNAIILFHLKTDRMPQWWVEKYPDELILYDDGGRKAAQCGPEKIENPSLASEIWLRYSCGVISKLTEYLKEKYPERFLGFYFGWGICGEWNYYGEPDMNDWRCPDFSPAMVRGFRKWLRKKYNTVQELQRAWGRDDVDFESAGVPERIERFRADIGFFKDPSKNAQVSDYYMFIGELAADVFISFCKTAKEKSGGSIICGGGYGGIMDINICAYLYFGFTTAGGIKKVLESPYVDFYSTPYSYYSRAIGDGDCSYMCLTESWRLHGKIRLGDNDTRTCLAEPFQEVFGRPDTIKDSIEILKRDFGQHLVRASGGWWQHKWLDHPWFIKTIRRLNKISDLAMKYDRSLSDGIAMIVDVESLFYQKMTDILMFKLLYEQRMKEFGRIGVPWHLYMLEDIEHQEMPEYRVYVFLNAFYVDEKKKRLIKEKICRKNNVVVWIYAPGFQSEKGFSTQNMEELTGIRIKYENISANAEIKIINFDHAITKDIHQDSKDSFFGARRMFEWSGTSSHGHMDHTAWVEPVFYADDPECKILGKIISINRPGFVVKEMKEWTSIYCASPMVSAKILRNICRYAGVHIYLETEDLLYANKHFIVIHTKQEGLKVIKLPVKANVYEVFDNRIVGKKITQFKEDLPAKKTAIYFLEYRSQSNSKGRFSMHPQNQV